MEKKRNDQGVTYRAPMELKILPLKYQQEKRELGYGSQYFYTLYIQLIYV